MRWFLSVNPQHLPEIEQSTGKRNFRSIEIDGRQWEFSNGFIDLHTESYEHILAGRGFGISDARPSIETVASIRTAKIMPLRGDSSPDLQTRGRGVNTLRGGCIFKPTAGVIK